MTDNTNLENKEIITKPIVTELIPYNPLQPSNNFSLPSITKTPLPILVNNQQGVVLDIGNFNADPGETITVPITISDAEEVNSLTLLFNYDSNLLSIPDRDPNTERNEGFKIAGVSSNWVSTDLETPNLVTEVNQSSGEGSIVLFASEESQIPEAGTSGTIIEIDFQVNPEATLGSIAEIDLDLARIGVNNEDLLFIDDSNLDDGNISIGDPVINDGELNTSVFRFQNTQVPGTYLFAFGQEAENVRNNFPNFNEEGTAFRVGIEPGDDLIPLYRFQSINTPGTYIFVSEGERDSINANFSDSFNEEGLAFYVYGVGSGKGVPFNRFQNTSLPGTFLFASPEESVSIETNFPNFNNEGIAFEVDT